MEQNKELDNAEHMFIMFVQGGEVPKGKMMGYFQNKVMLNIVNNMSGEKCPKQEDKKYIVIVDRGSKESCNKMQDEFWNYGSVNMQEKIAENMKKDRITPNWLKNKMKNMVDKSHKVKEYFDMIQAGFNIVTTTHVLPKMNKKELFIYFKEKAV